MTLLELLVKELPKRGGWPDNAVQSWQSLVDGEIYFDSSCGKRVEYRNGDIYLPIVGNGLDEVITCEQYEAAIAAQKPIAEFHSRTFPKFKAITVVERDDSWVGTRGDGEAYHCYKRHWDIEFISDQPVWNGEGLPPIGLLVELMDDSQSQTWGNVTIKYYGDSFAVWDDNGEECANSLCHVKVRPILTEAERKRKDTLKLIRQSVTNYNKTDVVHAIEEIYDAIDAGKIPGVKLV